MDRLLLGIMFFLCLAPMLFTQGKLQKSLTKDGTEMSQFSEKIIVN